MVPHYMVHEASLVKDFDHELLFYNHHFKIRNFLLFFYYYSPHSPPRVSSNIYFSSVVAQIFDFSIDRKKNLILNRHDEMYIFVYHELRIIHNIYLFVNIETSFENKLN